MPDILPDLTNDQIERARDLAGVIDNDPQLAAWTMIYLRDALRLGLGFAARWHNSPHWNDEYDADDMRVIRSALTHWTNNFENDQEGQ